jgi:hypothetical protein
MVELHHQAQSPPTTVRKMTAAEEEQFEKDVKERTERTSCFCGTLLTIVVGLVVVVVVTALITATIIVVQRTMKR